MINIGRKKEGHAKHISFEDRTFQFRNNMAILDALIVIVAMLLSIFYFHSIQNYDIGMELISNLSVLPITILLLSYFLYKFGAYNTPRDYSYIKYLFATTKSVVISLSLILMLIYLLNINYINRNVLTLFVVIVWISISFSRVISIIRYKRSVILKNNTLEVLIIGTGNRAMNLVAKLLEKSDWGVNIIGYLDVDPMLVGSKINDREVLGTLEDIHRVMKSHIIDEVIIAIPRAMISNMERIALACEEEGICLRVMADFFDVNVARIRLVEMGNIPLLTLEPIAHDEMRLLFKRVMDFIVTLLSMPLILPVMTAIAAAIRLDSPGPVFFTQDRVGKNKRIFKMYKFRSMVLGSENMMKELEHLNEAKGPIFKIAKDPRITKVGRFIRKTSLDELPQLFNVLLGEMSLVGPRPMSMRDVDLFDTGIQRKRFSMKPGLTCIWQISGRSNLPFEKWLELDLEYIENWSLLNDVKILMKTIPVVVNGSGAV